MRTKGSRITGTDYRSVLVTGGSSGIGKMIADGFAQNGAKVYIASRKEEQLKEVSDICAVRNVQLLLTTCHSLTGSARAKPKGDDSSSIPCR